MGKQLIIHFVGFCWLIGFKGTHQFPSAHARCDDPLLCPEHATCTNAAEDYYCTCQPGFLSTSGDTNFTSSMVRCIADMCTDSSSCPAFSNCQNIPGGYHCVCRRGFASSSGEQHFRDRTVKCNDVDECAQDPALCGPNASCRNTKGNFACSCFNGYKPTTGETGKRGIAHLNCTDIDECLNSSTCPANATCNNTLGGYYCTCNDGLASSSGERHFTDPAAQCTDIDECSQDPSPCGNASFCANTPGSYTCTCPPGFLPPSQPGLPFSCTDIDECLNSSTCPANATCNNTLGGYYCTCNDGLASSSGERHFTDPAAQCTDIDECSRDPSPCGNTSFCANTLGSYTCTCPPGFLPPSRPGLPFNCTDIDECSRDPSPCGNASFCANTPGSYTCTCPPGFLPPSQPGLPFSCTDIDECLNSSTCPANATCTNTPGGYYCTCNDGFTSSSGERHFTDPAAQCTDIDECSRDPSPCGNASFCANTPGSYTCTCPPGFLPPSRPGVPFSCTDIDECLNSSTCPANATCTNTLGGYYCTCNDGLASSSGEWHFTDPAAQCTDIDECSRDPSPCGNTSFCANTLGSYTCTCPPGFLPRSRPGVPFSCTEATMKCRSDFSRENDLVKKCQHPGLDAAHGASTNDATFCTLLNSTFSAFGDPCERKNSTVSLKNATEGITSILEQASSWSDLSPEQLATTATVFLQSVESVVLVAFANPAGNRSQTIRTERLEIQTKVVKDGCNMEDAVFSLEAKNETMEISCGTIQGSMARGLAGVAFASYVGMESILKGNFFQGQNATSALTIQMNSRVVGAFLTTQTKTNFTDPVNYTFQNIQPVNNPKELICVSWEAEAQQGSWSRAGCRVLRANTTHTTCSCNHVSNLAVLLALGEITAGFPLFLLSNIGLALSLLCLFLAILTFLLCRSIRNVTTSIHLQLCLCLFLADLLFLTGVDSASHELGCAVIAGLLHYLFLASFAWMFLEALVLFLTVRNLGVVNYFSTRSLKTWHLSVFGYGFPALVVAASAAVMPEGYGTQANCWLSMQRGFIWSFLGPVCAIIGVNSILFALTLWMLQRKLSSLNADVSTLKDTRLLTFKAIAQVFILGCTWIFGLFQFGPAATVMAYLFTIVNSLQGAFIFLVHCLLNRQVREEYKRWFTRKHKISFSEVSMSTLATHSRAA